MPGNSCDSCATIHPLPIPPLSQLQRTMFLMYNRQLCSLWCFSFAFHDRELHRKFRVYLSFKYVPRAYSSPVTCTILYFIRSSAIGCDLFFPLLFVSACFHLQALCFLTD